MIRFKCPHCGKDAGAPDQHAGKKARCPACKEILVVPGPSPAAGEAKTNPAPRAPAAKPPPPKPKPKDAGFEAVNEEEPLDVLAADDEDEAIREDRPRRGRPDEDDDDFEEDRPRRRKARKKKRRGRAGEWAPCPSCGSTDARRLHYTFWGGFIGPLIINCVRCNDCGTSYNGIHGDSNTTRIIIYFVVSCVIAVGVLVVCSGLGLLNQ